MRLISFVAGATMLSASLAAHADDLFTYTQGSNVLQFTLPASPTPISTLTENGGYFTVSVSATSNGVSESELVTFYNVANSGGFDDDLYNELGAQVYSGSESSPTFDLGTYSLTDELDAPTNATLTITPTSVTPEPSSIALLGTGMLGVAGVMRKRLA